MTEANPFAPYFNRLDELTPKLEDDSLDEAERAELTDLIRRATFFLVNHLNHQSSIVPTLFLDPPTVQGEAEDTAAPSAEQPESSAP